MRRFTTYVRKLNEDNKAGRGQAWQGMAGRGEPRRGKARNFKMRSLVLLTALIAAPTVAGAQTCQIPQSEVSPNRGQVHTQVVNAQTGQRMTFIYARSHVDASGVYAILGVVNRCPPQGCAPDPLQIHDCTVSAPTAPFFDWGAIHKGQPSPTTSLGFSIKDPSGTIVLSQDVLGQKPKLQSNVPCKQPEPGLPASVPVLHTEIEAVLVPGQPAVALGITSVRVYAQRHPGSTNIDFYVQINVAPNNTFPAESASACVTNTDNQQGWYDLYWSLSQNTTSEQLNLGGTAGSILLQQGF